MAMPDGPLHPRHEVRTDDGLFGPGSITWRIMGEPIMWVAGFRALYLQALHPRTMRGTWQNTALIDPKEACAGSRGRPPTCGSALSATWPT